MTTTTDKTYNGWTNYETWNVKLWIDNDEGSYNYWRETTKEVIDDNTEEDDDENEIFDKDTAHRELAAQLKDFVEENNPLAILQALSNPVKYGRFARVRPIDNADMYTDLLTAAISEVNWHEIAENMVGDCLE